MMNQSRILELQSPVPQLVRIYGIKILRNVETIQSFKLDLKRSAIPTLSALPGNGFVVDEYSLRTQTTMDFLCTKSADFKWIDSYGIFDLKLIAGNGESGFIVLKIKYGVGSPSFF